MRLSIRIAGWAAVLAVAGASGVAARPAQAPGRIDVENHASVGGSVEAPGKVEARFESIPTGDDFAGAEYWYEYGPTTAYGSRTASRTAPGALVVRREFHATSALLDYERRYHYRLVIQGPDGPLAGRDGTFLARHTALRPRARVLFNYPASRARRQVVTVTVLDAPRWLMSVTACKGKSERCTFVSSRRVGTRSMVIARAVDVPFGDRLIVSGNHELGGGRLSLATIFRAGARPVIRERCKGDVLLPEELAPGRENRCISVRTFTHNGRIARASIADAVPGTRVEILCRGPGCARAREVHAVRDGTFQHPYETIRLQRLTRVRPGATIEFYVTRPGSLGLYRRLKLTSRGLQRGPYRCIAIGSKRRLTGCG